MPINKTMENYVGFSFKGLLIDTMVCNYLESNENYTDKSELDILKGLFEYLSREDKNKSYWLALGSNQQINNNDNGKFIYKASQALKKLMIAMAKRNSYENYSATINLRIKPQTKNLSKTSLV